MKRKYRLYSLFFMATIAFVGESVSAQSADVMYEFLPGTDEHVRYYGASTAIDNGIAVIGAYGEFHSEAPGAAFLYDVTQGELLHTLYAGNTPNFNDFGRSVAIDKGMIVVGAPAGSRHGSNSGSAFIFDSLTGNQLRRLEPNDPAAGRAFGIEVAIGSDIVAVSAGHPDTIYLFDVDTGTQFNTLVPADVPDGFSFGFGSSIAIEGDIAIIGMPGDNVSGAGSGSAYIFELSTASQLAKLVPEDGMPGAAFGCSVEIDDGVIIIGAKYSEDNGNDSGSAYLFDAKSHEQIMKLLPSDGAELDRFGASVGISGGIVAVGASLNNIGDFRTGAVYLFDAQHGTELDKLVPADPVMNGVYGMQFGYSVSMDAGLVCVGVPSDVVNGFSTGSATLFGISSLQCSPADVNDDGDLNFFDISAFISAYNAGDLSADFTNDGLINFFDLSAFLQAFNAGCP